jgi:hypothetical protein
MANQNGVLTNIPDHYTTQFDSNWKHLVQQKNSKLKEYVTLDSIEGKEKSYNQLDATSMTQIEHRSGDTRISNQSMAKRWIRPQQYDCAKLVDEFDEQFLGEVVLPTSPIIQSHGAAYARTCDKVIIDALGGSASTGPTGIVQTPLSAGQKIGPNFVESGTPGANLGLTIGKLRAAKFLFDSNEVDEEEERILVVSAKQLQDLLRDTQVTSADYNTVRALVDGNINTFMGFRAWSQDPHGHPRRPLTLPSNPFRGQPRCRAYGREESRRDRLRRSPLSSRTPLADREMSATLFFNL